MTPARWNQVLDLFNATLERHPEDRAAYLDEGCAGDPDLRVEVESLLASYEDDPAYLEEPAVDLSGFPAGELPDAFEERHVGPYRLIRRLGRGGMGTVYLALRDDDQFKKYVALKLVRRGMDTDDLLRRFRTERQILASLDHPNIARLLDGGVTDDGLPYFVMEYLQGVPIDVYCDTHRLRVEERLSLFRDVCAAVAYAHQNLVVHRDLKPGNILVGAQGEVKLLDFGIAKLLDAEQEPGPGALTQPGVRVMTPGYASPEQVRGEAITTASDVYALGVLLYELLTGHHPFRTTGRSEAEVARVLCEEEPERPSTAVGRVVEAPAHDGTTRRITPQTVSAARSTRAERLRRQLAGDLDNIVLMALRKEPRRRYSSVDQLAEDVRRFQAGLPVLAQKDTFTYRASKFVRRHRGAVAGVAAVFAVVLAFGVVTAVQVRQIRAQAQAIALERDRSAHVSHFLKALFRVASPEVAQGDTVTARVLLERGVAEIERDLGGQPALQADLLQVMGEVYQGLGRFDRAEALLRRSVALRRAAGGASAAARAGEAAALDALAGLLRDRGRHAEAEPLVREALALQRGAADTVAARTLDNLAMVLRGLGRYREAEPVFREALARRLRHLGADHPAVVATRNDLALLLQDAGRAAAAESLFQQVLDVRRRQPGALPSDVAQSLNNLGLAQLERGAYAAAEANFREALAIRRRVFGDDHPAVATVLNNLGIALRRREAFGEAEAAFQRALVLVRRAHGADHPRVAATLSNLSDLRMAQGDLAAAEALQREAQALRQAAYGEAHPAYARGLNKLARVVEQRGRFDEADSLYREALDRRRALFGTSHPEVAVSLNSLGALHARRGDDGAAEPLLREALSIDRAAVGEDHPETLAAAANLAALLVRTGALVEAEVLYRDVLARQRRLFGERHARVGETIAGLASVAVAQRRPRAAESLYREAFAVSRAAHGGDHPALAPALAGLGAALRQLGRAGDAEAAYRRSADLARRAPGGPAPALAGTLRQWAALRAEQRDAAAAERLLREALALCTAPRAADDREAALVRADLGALLAARRRFDEAERLLLESYAALSARHPSLSALPSAALVDLYEAWGRAEQAAPYRAALTAH